MVDFHSHILPAMDDGSESVEQSLQMLAAMQAQGIDTVVATPHFDMSREKTEQFLARRQESFEKLQKESNLKIRVIPGAEVLYCGVPLHRCEDLDKVCIGNTRYLLIETLFSEWTEEFRLDLQYLMMERNIIPILAHIERYYFIGKNRNLIRALRRDGVLLQMNAEAFLHPKMRRRAMKIFKKESVHILGSDCHNLTQRPPNLGQAVALMQRQMGGEILDWFAKQAETILGDCL